MEDRKVKQKKKTVLSHPTESDLLRVSDEHNDGHDCESQDTNAHVRAIVCDICHPANHRYSLGHGCLILAPPLCVPYPQAIDTQRPEPPKLRGTLLWSRVYE